MKLKWLKVIFNVTLLMAHVKAKELEYTSVFYFIYFLFIIFLLQYFKNLLLKSLWYSNSKV